MLAFEHKSRFKQKHRLNDSTQASYGRIEAAKGHSHAIYVHIMSLHA